MIGTVRLLTKASLLFLGITSLLICLAGAKAQNAASSTAQRYFNETFADPSVSSSRWDQATNGGTLLFSNGRVFLKGIGSGYPVIKTRQNPFPASGDFTFSFGYRFTSIGNYGTGLNCVGTNGHIVADLHQDVNGQLLQVDDNISWQHPDTEWHVASFVMTGNRMSVYLDGSHAGDHDASTRPTGITIGGGTMSNPWDWNDLQIAFIRVDPGKQVFDKSALHLNDMPSAVAKTFPPLPHQISNVNVQDSDNALYCVMGDTVHLAGTTSGQHRLDRRSLTVNSQPYFDTPAGSNEDGYNFDWKPAAPGTYKIAVSFTLQKPYAVLSVKDVNVNVLPKAPLALQQFLEPVPASCPVAVQAADTSVFHPARVEFFLNDQSVGTATQAPFQVTLPISKQAPGSYKVSYQAYDAQRVRLNGESETVTVPVRVQLTMPATVNLAATTDKTTFTSSIVPNLKIVRVDYSVDGQHVASTTLPPYDASASLSAFKSGSHSIKSEVLIEDGETFSNPSTTVSLTNRPDDERLARLTKEDADRQAAIQKDEEAKQAKLAKQVNDAVTAKAEQERVNKEIDANIAYFWPRPGFDEKVFRKQAAALAYYVPKKRYGDVGKVHGLSVLSITENGETISETGQPLTVSASVRPGTGQTNFLAFSEEDAKITAQQAAEYCKTKTGFYHWDWSKYDLTVAYLENDPEAKHTGPSAGGAEALAMMSAILNLPVDNSVAMTGAITLQGQIEPVGGIIFKAAAAFDKDNVHTLLMPVDFVGSESLYALYKALPKLCFRRRVVFVRNMDDVMTQALIELNTDEEVREEKLVQGGLRHFARGEDKQALAAFAAAKAITPGNWTADFWISMVYAVEKQHNEDALTASGK